MPSRKRKVTYEENADANGKSVNVEESHEETNESLTEQDDERYSPASGN